MLDIDTLQQEMNQLIEDKKELDQEIKAQREELEEGTATNNDDKINKAKVQLYDLRTKLDTLNRQIQDMTEEIDKQRAPEVSQMEEQDEDELSFKGGIFGGAPSFARVKGSISPPSRNWDNHYHTTGHSGKAPKFKAGDDVCVFLDRFRNYIEMNRIADNLDRRLTNLIEDNTLYRKVSKMQFSETDRSNAGRIVTAVKKGLFPDTDTKIMRTTFNRMRQNAGETVEQFAQRVQDAAERIFLNDAEREGAAISTFISGLEDVAIRRRLFQMSKRDGSGSFTHVTREAVNEEHISKAISGEADDSIFNPTFGDSSLLFSMRQEPETPNVRRTQERDNVGHVTSTFSKLVICQWCQVAGHEAKSCGKLNRTTNVTETQQEQSTVAGTANRRSTERRGVICYNCQGVGHISRNCSSSRAPQNNARDYWQPTRSTSTNSFNRQNQQGMQRSHSSFKPSIEQQREQQQVHLNGQAAGQNPVSFSRQMS